MNFTFTYIHWYISKTAEIKIRCENKYQDKMKLRYRKQRMIILTLKLILKTLLIGSTTVFQNVTNSSNIVTKHFKHK